MTYKQELENKINNTSLSLDERENRFLDLQIYEIIEQEKKDNIIINLNKKRLNYVFNNLNFLDFEFEFCEKIDTNDNYVCIVFVKNKDYETFIDNIYYFNEYDYINLMTLEEIKILKDYQEKKNNEKENDNLEFEI